MCITWFKVSVIFYIRRTFSLAISININSIDLIPLPYQTYINCHTCVHKNPHSPQESGSGVISLRVPYNRPRPRVYYQHITNLILFNPPSVPLNLLNLLSLRKIKQKYKSHYWLKKFNLQFLYKINGFNHTYKFL